MPATFVLRYATQGEAVRKKVHDRLQDNYDERAAVESFLHTRSEIHFRRLYRIQAPRMLRLAQRLVAGTPMVADDIVQEAWVRAITALPRFEWRSALSTWLGGFVVNIVREQARSGPRPESQRNSAGDDESDPSLAIDVDHAIQSLPPGFRSVLMLHDIGGFTHQEIAEALGVDPGTSKSQLSRARARMRVLLGRQ